MLQAQWGAKGAFLIVPVSLNSNAAKTYNIGDRFDVRNLGVRHKTFGTFDMSGVWYIYSISHEHPSMIHITLIRGSSKLCFMGDGSVIKASSIENLYGIKGYKPDEDFYITLKTDQTIYHNLVLSAHRLRYLHYPIFMPDGSLSLVNMGGRPVVDPTLYSTIVAHKNQIGFSRQALGLYEYATSTYIIDYFVHDEVPYPPGTIIKYSIQAKQGLLLSDTTFYLGAGGSISSVRALCLLIAL